VSAGARFRPNPDFVYRKVIDEVVLVPIHHDVAKMDCIYTLNAVGACVWESLGQGATLDELERAVLERFEADPGTVATDVSRFVVELEAAGAVQRV